MSSTLSEAETAESGTPLNDISTAIPFDSLPEEHLVRLLVRMQRQRHGLWDDTDFRRSLLAALAKRLETHSQEARQWVDMGPEGRILFLHQLCGIHLVSALENQVLQVAIDAFPEALRAANSEGYFPLHILCRHFHLDAFNIVFSGAPDMALEQVLSDGNTALHCLAGTGT